MKEKRADRTLEIFLTFLKFGCFTFGGGWSIVAQIQKEFVEKKHWISQDELMDITPHEHDQIRKYLGLSDVGKLMVDITLDAVHDREKRLERKSHL